MINSNKAMMVPTCVIIVSIFELYKINFSNYIFSFQYLAINYFHIKAYFYFYSWEEFHGLEDIVLNNGLEKLVISSSKGNSTELKHVVQVINEEPKVLFSEIKIKEFKTALIFLFNKYLRVGILSTDTLQWFTGPSIT